MNLVALNYLPEKMEILVGSDGSTDNTNEILNRIKDSKLRIFTFPKRLGKPSVLNALAKKAKGELLIFADCRQDWEKNSLKILVRNFAAEKVGVVSGLVYEGEAGYYRKYENFIRLQESKFNSVPGATGALYGIRSGLFKPLPADTILDDFVTPMEVVKQRFRSVLEPAAIAYDITFRLSYEKVRKVRTIAGNFQAFLRYPWFLNLFKNPIWFQTFSHKFLRLTAPLFFFLLFIFNISLWEISFFYKIFLILQILFYLCSCGGKIRLRMQITTKPKRVIEKLLLLTGTFLVRPQ